MSLVASTARQSTDARPTLIDLMFGADPAAPNLIGMLQRPVVIDANVLIEDALRRTSGRHCSLQFAAETGSARLFAPPQLLPEVMKNLQQVCGIKHDPDRVMATIRERYLPYLRIVDVTGISIDDPRVDALRQRHAKDVAYAVLALLLSPSVLLTNDRDILDQGLGDYHDRSSGGTGWTYGAVSLQDTAILPAGVFGLTLTMAGTAAAIGAGLDVARSGRVPPALVVAACALAVGGVAVLSRTSRGPSIAEQLGGGLAAAGRTFGRALATGAEWWGEATQMLNAGAVTTTAVLGPSAEIARLLTRSRAGLSADEIRAASPGIADPAAILVANRIFVEAIAGHWMLGQPALAWAESTTPESQE